MDKNKALNKSKKNNKHKEIQEEKENIEIKDTKKTKEEENMIESNSEKEEDIASPEADDNNWSKFQLNKKLSSNLSKIFPVPTNIQEKTLIYANAKVDLIIQARTGEGKTLCYAIPVLNYIFNFYDRAPNMQKKISPVALILVPTHELGVQVKNHIEMVIEQKKKKDEKKNFFYNIKIANVLGGFAKVKQLKILNKYNPEIIIATPGRLWEIIDNDEASVLDNLKFLKFLIIDEADRMTQTGHFKELKNIIDHIYSRIEIKTKKGNKDDGLMKEKLKKLGFNTEGDIDKKLDEEENKKLAETLNIDINKIETIDPMALMGNNPNFDTLDFTKKNENNIEEDNIDDNDDLNNEENEENIEDQEEENNNGNEDIQQEKEEDEFDEEEMDEKEDDMDEEGDIDFDKEEKEMTEEEKREIRKNIKNLKKDNIKEGEEIIEYEKSVNLRTILCSATIDSLKKAQKFKKFKKNNSIDKNNLSEEQKHFQNLIKNLKFYISN